MLAALDKQTSAFGSVDTSKWLSAVTQGNPNAPKTPSKTDTISLEIIEAGVEVYRILHYFSPEYLSRASRVELTKRALAADVLAYASLPKEEPELHGLVEWRAVLRSFVLMVARQTQAKVVDEMVLPPVSFCGIHADKACNCRR